MDGRKHAGSLARGTVALVLAVIVRNPRRVLSRDLLLSRVWDQELDLTTNLVHVHVGYLRNKVDAPGEEKLIRTVWGTGYALREA